MKRTVISLVKFARRLRSFAQRQTILGLISLALGGIVPLAVAEGATSPESSTSSAAAVDQGDRIRNIVLVHGAWADGSGWKGVYDILVKDGFNVSIVQEPEPSFKDDVAATN